MIPFLLFLFWLGFCILLRYRRLCVISSMDPVRDAVALSKLTLFVEFPLLSKKALQFALFKTFAIPSISKLLAATHQLSPAAVNKRYDDTDILLQELLLSHITAPGDPSHSAASTSFTAATTSPTKIFSTRYPPSYWSPSDLPPSSVIGIGRKKRRRRTSWCGATSAREWASEIFPTRWTEWRSSAGNTKPRKWCTPIPTGRSAMPHWIYCCRLYPPASVRQPDG